MKKHVHILVLSLCLLCGATAQAEVIRLKSGKEVTGTILLRNEEVVVFRDASGKRFQYPMRDVEVILTDEEAAQRAIGDKNPGQISARTSTNTRFSMTAWSAFCVHVCILKYLSMTARKSISVARTS